MVWKLTGLRYEKHQQLKNRAQQAVMKALREGTLTKSLCEVCGRLVVEAHHDDYNKPLEVRWLCKSHHREAHGHKSRMIERLKLWRRLND